MGNSSLKISCGQILFGVLAAMVVLWVGGCGDFFDSKHTGLQSQAIIDDLSKIEPVSEPNISVPEIYKAPPKIVEQMVGGTPEFKLFYFCKYHTSDEIREIVHAQFATKLFKDPKKGQVTSVPDYTVSSNPATNQLIVRCPAREDATAVLELLEMVDVLPIQVKINCLISEVYADLTLDWETTLEIENLLGEGIRAGSSAQSFGTGITKLVEEGNVLPAFPGASLREIARERMGLQVGYLSTSKKFLAMVDLLESKGYLKILMNPTLEVVNGKKATISSTQHVPLQTITKFIPVKSSGEYAPQIETEYIDVVDSLEITPHVFADGYIGLEANILLGSKMTPEGIKQVGIVTKKEIENEENRIRHGESLIIGGIRKTEKRDVVRGIPGLKDIPIVGVLFSGRDFEERVVETIFILTPTISTGGIPNQEMVEDIRKKHASPAHEGMYESITDPFGVKELEGQHEKKLFEAEEARLEADAEKARARSTIRQAEERLEKAEAEIEKLNAEVEEAKTEAEEAKEEAEEAKEKAEKPTVRNPQAKVNPRAKNPRNEANKPRPEKPKQEAGKKEIPSNEADRPKAGQKEQANKTKADDEV